MAAPGRLSRRRYLHLTDWRPNFTQTFLAILSEILRFLRFNRVHKQRAQNRRTAMKRLAVLAFSLGVMVAPFQAHAQKRSSSMAWCLIRPPVPGYEAPKTQAPTKARTTTHQQHHHHRAHAAS
jgi:hypothetical protein